MPLFISIALLVWACLNAYVFRRLGSLPLVANHVPAWAVWSAAAACWAGLPASRWLPRFGFPELGMMVESCAMTWLGILFLLFVCFLAVDCLTLGGFFLSARVPQFRAIAAASALLLAVIAMVQGRRAPVVNEQAVSLPGLPPERDGLRIAFVSDLHLGGQLGPAWLHDRVAQITALKPDLIALGGDIIDHDVLLVQGMIGELRALRAPLGVWAVLGNHDSFRDAAGVARLLDGAGFRVLRDESAAVVPGLRIAGVDDLGMGRRSNAVEPAIRRALQSVSTGNEGCVFLSHTPVGMSEAAKAGAGLMLCGHTHGGQIWPFNFLVALRYPELVGRFAHDPMTLIISRGAGTWGPRMRLWRPGEIALITLRSPQPRR